MDHLKHALNALPPFRAQAQPSCESAAPCRCTGSGVSRRDFLRTTGAGFAAVSLANRAPIMAGPFTAADTRGDHLVPADKHLDPGWIAQLFERGAKEVYRGAALENIGMPCGGIGAGQLYLCGDGTLGCWQIFNNAASNWVGDTHSTYEHRGVAKPVDFGLAVQADAGGGSALRELCKDGFDEVEFKGTYPIGTVSYRAGGFPLEVTLEAFSPFIPLNAKDSTLPATVFHVHVQNTSDKRVKTGVAGWLENGVCKEFAREHDGLGTTRIVEGDGRVAAVHGAQTPPPPENDAPPPERPAILFEDFEGDNYGAWTVAGEAFGTKPAPGTLPNQQHVSGFMGQGLVNTFLEGDGPLGTLASPEFTIERRFINFLLGGGGHADKTCMNLVVDGEVVRTAKGVNHEQLTWRHWDVSQFEGKQARLVIVDDASGGWGHINVDHIEFADTLRAGEPVTLPQARDYGTMALTCLGAMKPKHAADALKPGRNPDEFICEGAATYNLADTRRALVRTDAVKLKPGERHTFSFVLAWHFPNQPEGHEYAARFDDAPAVADYVCGALDRLTADTRLWRDTYYDSSLPYWLLDRLHATVCCLATGTAQYWKNGRFWAYEGVCCCAGTCTHVWNYAHAHARLFPELARSIREMQDFRDRKDGGGFHPDTGLVGFRSNDAYAADGQCGTILKAYREHLLSPDTAFLERNWPRIKKALEYSIGRDANADGLIEDSQHNTYDINYHGANTFVGSLYLAALRAGEEMAREMGDDAFAEKARAIYESGRKLTLERLWNGEYFIQDVDLDKHPKHQYGNGCLSDHLFGQGWAHQVGLGYIYPQDKVRAALEAVWKYNWAPDITPYNEAYKPFRWFISPGQAGLFTCTWPHGAYLPEGTLYKSEVWTGIEYQVAGHMVAEGMVTEALAICRAVHDRYQPQLYNPYNEIECGDHYARAMASWGVYTALAGFAYHGPRRALAFNPKMPGDAFRAAFTTAEGWGTYDRRPASEGGLRNTIALAWGTLALDTVTLGQPGAAHRVKTVALNGQPVDAWKPIEGPGLRFEHTLTLNAGDRLEITLA